MHMYNAHSLAHRLCSKDINLLTTVHGREPETRQIWTNEYFAEIDEVIRRQRMPTIQLCNFLE